MKAALPIWLVRFRRMLAALANHEAFAPEDADALRAAFEASAAARWDDGAISIESGLGFPPKWRSMKRLADQAAIFAECAAAGYRGREGAKRLHDAARKFSAARYRYGAEPECESDRIPFRLWEVFGGDLPAQSTLAKALK